MKVLVTGANGFIGKNLVVHLRERSTELEIIPFLNGESIQALKEKVSQADFVFHLAGVNRPKDENEFAKGNTDLTRALCAAIEEIGRPVPVVYSSSSQAERDNAYGRSKRAAEQLLLSMSERTAAQVYIYRLPNVFGKWCRPNYNSVVATFCHNIAHDLPIVINDAAVVLDMVYVDDVVAEFLSVLDNRPAGGTACKVEPVYRISLGDLAGTLQGFRDSRTSLHMDRVGTGLIRALYSTYITYLTPEQFSYPLKKHEDPRGAFIEVLKTKDSGQFSYFTAHPGVTRGGHYHHTKNEKFLVVKGEARFRFRHIESGAVHELCTSGVLPQVVETIPGWSHDITNIGNDEMIVMLWANEVFDRQRPDTIAYKV